MLHPTHYFEKFFYWLGYRIGKHPKWFITVILIVTFLLSLGLFRFKEVNNVRTEYSPLNAPSKNEYAVAKQFLKQNGTLDPSYIMTRARDGGSLLREEYRWLVYNLTRALQTEVKVTDDIKGRTYTFLDLCEPYCEMNTAFLAFLKLYDSNNPSTFTYPSIELFGTKAFIGNNVYGIKLKDVRHEKAKVLGSFTTAIMPFYLVADYEDTDIMIKWQHKAIELFERPQYSNLLKTGMTGDNLVSYEVRRMGIETGPLIFGSIAMMILFVIVTSFRVKASESKPWESFVGCLVPLLAMVAAMGAMSALGIHFQSIVVAAIFLVLSVGVDDIFILIRAWHRSSQLLLVHERLAVTLEEAGPSITISSSTNVISFAIGALSDTPAVRTFCIFSAVAITICYLYQLILLAAILALSGRRENESSTVCCFKTNPQSKLKFVEYGERIQRMVVKQWAWAVTKWQTRVSLSLLMVFYFYVSWLGIRQLQSNISIDKMALEDSYLHDFQHSFETALRNMQPISVFVLKPGDLRQPEQLKRIKNLVSDFEHSLNAYGSESTFFWLNQYEDFLRFYSGENVVELEEQSLSGADLAFSYTEIPTFFKSATYFYLSSFVHLNESACEANLPECITSFFFITNFHEVIKYHELVPTVKDWRRIAAKYEDLNVYAYSDHTPFVDQTMSIDQTVFGSVGAALGCTALVVLIFIPHFLSVVVAVFSVFSISWGIFGILSLWSVDLDPLSMAALLMAIGFSVDFTSHISYHYYKAPKGSPRRRMQWALGVIGWPMMQVGLSTIVALLPLLFKQSYLAMVFLKTIIVVVLLGMFHGLVILPAILTMLSPPGSSPNKSKAKTYLGSHVIRDQKYREGSAGSGSVTENGQSNNSSLATSETNSGHNSSSGSSSERSSQRSQRNEKYYKSHILRAKSMNKDFGWLNQNRRRSLFSLHSTKETLSPDKIVTPLDVSHLAGGGKVALVHKIALGRSNSNPVL